jgi:hypothetical protein
VSRLLTPPSSHRFREILRPRHPRKFFAVAAGLALTLVYSPLVAGATGSASRVATVAPSPTPSGGPANNGILKICVAGSGAAQGTQFAFTAGTWSGSVRAGPAPGGYCIVGPSLPTGSLATIQQTISPYDAVSSITVAPLGQLVSTNVASGTANVTIGSGATEVTYTDNATTGYLEICANGNGPNLTQFTVNPGNLGPFAVPLGACSPAITLTSGSTVITGKLGCVITGSTTIPASRQLSWNGSDTTVTVVGGDISTQTIVTITTSTLGVC